MRAIGCRAPQSAPARRSAWIEGQVESNGGAPRATTSMSDEAARTAGVDGGTIYRYQQEIAQMVRIRI